MAQTDLEKAELVKMLLRIVTCSTPTKPDSTGQSMRRVRQALIDQAGELLAKQGYRY